MVYIVYRILSLVLGERGIGNLLSNLGQAIAFSLIAVGVWLYHGAALRGDGRLSRREQARRLAEFRVAVVDVGEGHFGRAVLDGLRRELPDLSLDPIGLATATAEAVAMSGSEDTIADQLAGAKLIIGPWTIAIPGAAGGAVTAKIAGAVVSSPACKLLVPVRAAGWEWVGVDPGSAEALVRQTVRAVKQWVEGEEIRAARPLGAGAIVGIVVGVLFLLILLAIAMPYLLRGF